MLSPFMLMEKHELTHLEKHNLKYGYSRGRLSKNSSELFSQHCKTCCILKACLLYPKTEKHNKRARRGKGKVGEVDSMLVGRTESKAAEFKRNEE